MTWITDDNGTRWVEYQPRQRRKSPRPVRFADLKVGQQIMQKPRGDWFRKIPMYYIVTDLWFDPVQGQNDPIKGQMVGYSHIMPNGEVIPRKSSTTLRGLASQQFEYADMDYIAHCKARAEEAATGKVVGISHAKVIRARPKLAGL